MHHIVMIPIEKIKLNPNQPRKSFIIDDLVESMRAEGFKANFPVTVRHFKNSYQLVFGERRLRAAKKVGILEVPCIALKYNDEQAELEAFNENSLRKDLDPVEEANCFMRLKRIYGRNNVQIAKLIHKDEKYVRDRLKLLNLDEKLQLKVLDIGLRKAEHISGLDKDVQLKAAEKLKDIGHEDTKLIVDKLKKVRRDKFNSSLEAIRKKFSGDNEVSDRIRDYEALFKEMAKNISRIKLNLRHLEFNIEKESLRDVFELLPKFRRNKIINAYRSVLKDIKAVDVFLNSELKKELDNVLKK